MKILHIGKYYSPIQGGIESINQVIVDSLKGNQQRVISFNNRAESEEEDVDAVPIIRAGSLGEFARQPISLRYWKEMRRSIKLFRPDIIHFHYPNPLGALYLMLTIKKEQKLIIHWHSDIVAQKKISFFIKPFEKIFLKRANCIIATSPNYILGSNTLSKFYNKIKVIPCSINEENFKKRDDDDDAIVEIQNKYGGKPIVFFVGRHVEYKGIEYLLKAERLVKSDCVFLIAGNGPLTEKLKNKYVSERLYWLGRVSNDEIRRMMYASTIYAFPSITKNEAFGVALAEAMYCYCPAVTFTIKNSGVNWVAPNKICALESTNGDVSELANAIDELINNPDLLHELSLNAHNRVDDMFTNKSVKQLYWDLYQSLLK